MVVVGGGTTIPGMTNGGMYGGDHSSISGGYSRAGGFGISSGGVSRPAPFGAGAYPAILVGTGRAVKKNRLRSSLARCRRSSRS